MGHYTKGKYGTVHSSTRGDVIATRTDGLWHWADGRRLSSPAQRIFDRGYSGPARKGE